MFKRRSFRRRPSFRRATRFAKKKTQWVVGYNSGCNITLAEPGDACPNGTNIALLTNDEVRKEFEDALIVRRIIGNLHFSVYPQPLTPDCDDILSAFAGATLLRIGLKKSEVSQTLSGFPIAFNPLKTGAAQDDLGDFEDGRWIRQWEHLFIGEVGVQRQQFPHQKVWKPEIFDCLTDQPTCITSEALTSGDGHTWGTTVNHDPIKLDGECVDCDPEGLQDVHCQYIAMQPKVYNLAIDYKRPIRLRDNNTLDLWIGWETLGVGFARLPQVTLAWAGGLRMLIEK
jgi:hypothetical protein